MPQKPSPVLQKARMVYYELKRLRNPTITLRTIEGYHLKKDRLMKMLKKLAIKEYGLADWETTLKENYNFEYPMHTKTEANRGFEKANPFVRFSTFGDATTIIAENSYLFFGSNPSLDNLMASGYIGSELGFANIPLSVINSETSRNSDLGFFFLTLPSWMFFDEYDTDEALSENFKNIRDQIIHNWSQELIKNNTKVTELFTSQY